MFWNVQGAAPKEFRRAFKTIMGVYLHVIVVLFETRCSGGKADDFVKRSGFDRSHRIEARGFSRGIWVFWNDGIDVQIIENHKQFVHLHVLDEKGHVSVVTAVYASPIPSNSKLLWYELDRISQSMSFPWLIGRDFNAILHAFKKKGGAFRYVRGC